MNGSVKWSKGKSNQNYHLIVKKMTFDNNLISQAAIIKVSSLVNPMNVETVSKHR